LEHTVRYRETEALTPRSSAAANRDSSGGSLASGLHSPQLDRGSKRESGLSLTDSYKTAYESEQEVFDRSRLTAGIRASPRSEPESSGYETPGNSASSSATMSRANLIIDEDKGAAVAAAEQSSKPSWASSPRRFRSQTQPVAGQDTQKSDDDILDRSTGEWLLPVQ
jgi:hypothetical protein